MLLWKLQIYLLIQACFVASGALIVVGLEGGHLWRWTWDHWLTWVCFLAAFAFFILGNWVMVANLNPVG